MLDWGSAVRREGLVDAFGVNYGIFSYALFGAAAPAAELVPRLWWAPYKLIILIFDIAVLAALLRIVPPEQRRLALVLFWLNPWFVLHEAYHGFWEAPHILFGLLAVIAAARVSRRELKWALVGALLACSAMFKPQGLIHFIGPFGLHLGVQAIRGAARPLAWFLAGASAVAIGLSLAIYAVGGPALALVDNYRTAVTVMAGISNGGPGIWRFVAFAYMTATGQNQTIPFVKMPRVVMAAASAIAAVISAAILAMFAFRTKLKDENSRETARVVLAVLAIGSLVMSQFGVRAHINHSYPAMVLLIPLAVANGRMRKLWVAMCVLLGVSHVLVFGLGLAALLPPAEILFRYPAAQDLIARVTALPAYSSPDWPLRLQLWVSHAIEALSADTIVSLLSIPVFAVACLIVRALFIECRSDRP